MESDPPWRAGGGVAFSVDAIAMPDSTAGSLDLSIRVPPATIAKLWRAEDGSAKLHLEAVVKGRPVGTRRSEQDIVLAAGDSVLGYGKVLAMRFAAPAGRYDVRVRLVDMLSHKRGIALRTEDTHEASAVSGTVIVPAPQAGRDLSGIQFTWPEPRGGGSLAFVRNGRMSVPNPDRLYGLFAEHLSARFVARARSATDVRPWHWVARVFDSQGQGVAQHETTTVATAVLDAEVAFDVSHEPAGAYSLEIKAWQDGDAGALVRRGIFSIGWQKDTWLRSAVDIADDAHFLLSADEEQDFVVMPPGQQERLLQDFWSQRDPSPETAENEAYETFVRRVEHANEVFSRTGVGKGMFSDMGRVYIRYGEPTEVLKQVMPAGNETLTEQLQSILNTESRSPDGVQSHGLGGDQRPYEVWEYEGEVPLPLDVDPHDPSRGHSKRRILFLFVDEQGTGQYRLRYSTE